MAHPPIVVLVVASGAAWESPALGILGAHPGIVVLKRCVDVDDLLAAASAGQADVAVLGLDAPGLDVSAVDHLRAHGVRPVAIVAADAMEAGRVRASRIGIIELVAEDDLDALPDAVTAADSVPTTSPAAPAPDPSGSGAAGPVIAVWGPAGAPGRTTVAAGIAAHLADRELRTILVDADPHGASVGQQLGIVDGVSGLLAAARLTVSGQLEERFASVQRGIDSHLSVVTGLPRPDRWVELRSGAVQHLLETARRHAHVVVDTGFSLEDDPGHDFGTRPPRNQLTLATLEVADEVVVVGSADPVGLSRLVRGLAELRELAPATPLRVVVNRMRPSLGWSEKDVAGMVGGFARLAGLHLLPDDQLTVDRALVAGRTLPELGDSAISRALSALVDAVLVSLALAATPRIADTAHRR
jgi:MinD-like ATPase involved in chromosome partitioning or flagellar assembly